MTILDTFFIKFTSDSDQAVTGAKKVEQATKAVEASAAALSKFQEDAGKKVGKNLSEQEKQEKHLQETHKKNIAERRTAQKEQEIIDKRQLDTGKEFVKTIEQATAAAAAYLSIKSLTGNIFNTAESNSQLKVQADLLGQNVESAKALNAAGQAHGGANGAIFAQYKATFQEYAKHGIKIGSIEQLNDFYRKQLNFPQYKDNPVAQQRYFQAQGINDIGQQSLLLDSEQNYKKEIDFQKSLTSSTAESIQTAREFERAWSHTQSSLDSVFTQLGGVVLPFLTKLNEGVQSFDKYLSSHPLLLDSLAVGVTSLGAALALSAIGIVASLTTIGAAATVTAIPFATIVAGIAAVGALVSTGKDIYDNRSDILDYIQDYDYRKPGKYVSKDAKLTRGLRNNNPGNLRSWSGAANEGGFAKFDTMQNGVNAMSKQLELYNSRGNNTLSGIISTYAPSNENNTAAYIAEVAKDTGFNPNEHLDMGNASIRSKVMAAMIKHKNGKSPFDNKQILGMISAGQQNIDIASTSPYGMTPISGGSSNKNINVKMGDIIIHTKATSSDEISRNIASEFFRQLKSGVNGIDDGIAM
jgi:hypothetical protein